jgi:DMSO/TMAO reductase YedYZ heme-binding membrane subunit
VVGGWLFVLITSSFWLRKRIGTRNWRRLHWFTYALFGLATIHGITAGTDTTQPWVRDLYLGAVGSVVAATAWRALVPPARRAALKGELR